MSVPDFLVDPEQPAGEGDAILSGRLSINGGPWVDFSKELLEDFANFLLPGGTVTGLLREPDRIQ
jgi:hypothetical protein